MTSGYSVPCTRNLASVDPAPASSKTRMNSSPMALRFCSGSVTPARRSKKRSAARTWMSSMPWWRRNVSTTWSPSPLRMRPVSTNTQVSWAPMALCTSAAATAESTPPDSPQITRPSPTWARIASTAVSTKFSIVQSAGSPRDVVAGSAPGAAGRAGCARPRGGTARRRCAARGSRAPRPGRPAVAAVDDEALRARSVTASKWLIHTVWVWARSPTSSSVGAPSIGSRTVRPYSPAPPRPTVAAELLGDELGAVADAQDGDAEVVDTRVDARARPRRGPTSGPPERMMAARRLGRRSPRR